MANYYRNITKYLITGIAAGSGGWIFYYGLLHNKRSKVFAAQATGDNNVTGKWDPNWDKRDPTMLLKERGIDTTDANYKEKLEKNVPKATRHIFLIRHGQYNLDGGTDKERFLTQLGKTQAEFTGHRLKELKYPYTALHKSTMTRAQETADIILEALKDTNIPLIRDCSLLEEGAPSPPDPPIKHWRPEKHFYRDGARIEAAFRKYIHRAEVTQLEDSYEVIVCHSNVIRYFVCRALQFPPSAWLRFTLHHCSITWLVINPAGRVIIRGLGDSGHLPPDCITSS